MSASLSRRASHLEPFGITRNRVSIPSLTYTRSSIDVVSRVRGEFVEMRGFSPTVEQAARLFDLSPDECTAVLSGLVQQRFLTLTSDGRYRLMP
jgi:hypothetical protein